MAILKKNINLSSVLNLCEEYNILTQTGVISSNEKSDEFLDKVADVLANINNRGEWLAVVSAFWTILGRSTIKIESSDSKTSAKKAYDIKKIINWIEENSGSINYDTDGII